jgi:hypothetical protein
MRLHLTMLAPYQVVQHKSFLVKVNLDLVLSQKLVVPTNFARELHYMTITSKSLIQEILDNLNPFC